MALICKLFTNCNLQVKLSYTNVLRHCSKTSSFSEAFQKFEKIQEEVTKPPPPPTKPSPPPVKPVEEKDFFTLLRHSQFINLGDPNGKIVSGKIFHVVNDDLYIDFGGKFHAVCRRPQQNSLKYVKGANVRIRLQSLELSHRFLGAQVDLTLLESDAVLLGLESSAN